LRAQYDAIIDRLIEKAHADPAFDERSDVLAIMLQSSYDDGSKMSNSEIADELLTMLAAGHETTATTLAWAVERLRRHPEIVSRLAAEVASGGSGLLAATITEVQRSRPVIDGAARQATVDGAKLGRWTLPKGQTIFVSATLLHENEELFPNPHRFYPDRFLDVKVDPYTWIPFGGGTRRCIGAAFAQMEMNIVLRTLIRDFELEPTSASDEAWRSRGVAWSPKEGGLAVVFRRSRPLRAAEDAAPESASADKRAAGRAKARPVKKAPAPLSSAADGTMSQAGTTP
jgi:cytochrome P450